MADALMTRKYTGPLCVTLHTLEGYIDSITLNFRDTTIFEYIGEACGRIFTNLTTQHFIQTGPEDWKVLNFSPEKRKLEVVQIAGEPLKIKDDDLERLASIVESALGEYPRVILPHVILCRLPR
jgi:hypothetical protein